MKFIVLVFRSIRLPDDSAPKRFHINETRLLNGLRRGGNGRRFNRLASLLRRRGIRKRSAGDREAALLLRIFALMGCSRCLACLAFLAQTEVREKGTHRHERQHKDNHNRHHDFGGFG